MRRKPAKTAPTLSTENAFFQKHMEYLTVLTSGLTPLTDFPEIEIAPSVEVSSSDNAATVIRKCCDAALASIPFGEDYTSINTLKFTQQEISALKKSGQTIPSELQIRADRVTHSEETSEIKKCAELFFKAAVDMVNVIRAKRFSIQTDKQFHHLLSQTMICLAVKKNCSLKEINNLRTSLDLLNKNTEAPEITFLDSESSSRAPSPAAEVNRASSRPSSALKQSFTRNLSRSGIAPRSPIVSFEEGDFPIHKPACPISPRH